MRNEGCIGMQIGLVIILVTIQLISYLSGLAELLLMLSRPHRSTVFASSLWKSIL